MIESEGDKLGVQLFVKTDLGFGSGLESTGVGLDPGAVVNCYLDEDIGGVKLDGTVLAAKKRKREGLGRIGYNQGLGWEIESGAVESGKSRVSMVVFPNKIVGGDSSIKGMVGDTPEKHDVVGQIDNGIDGVNFVKTEKLL